MTFLKINTRAQSSFEYILIVGLIMLFIVGGIGFLYSYSQKSNDDVSLATIGKAGQDIILTADKVYYIGSDSWETIKINLPATAKDVYIVGDSELVIEYASYGGISQNVFFSDINITTPYLINGKRYLSNSSHSGITVLRITSQGSFVNITEVN